jgi:hypothetical protein
VPDGDGEGDGLGGGDPSVGEGLALGLGVGEAAPGDGLGLGRLVRVGPGLVRYGCGVGLAAGGEVAGGESTPPDPVTEDTGRTTSHSANTPRNRAVSTRVEVRGRPGLLT